MPTSIQPTVASDVPRGATILTAYSERQVRAYPVFENEVKSIAMLNTLATVFFSAGSVLLGFAIGIWTNAGFAENPTPEGRILSNVVAPALCVAAALAAAVGIWGLITRRSTWDEIKAEAAGKATTTH